MPPPSLTIQFFGALRVLIGGEPMPRLRTRPVEWLLALLVLRHGRAVDRSWLAGTLWPESDERQALHNLRDALVHLRKGLGPERARLDSPTRDTLRLDLTGAEVDVVRFDAAMKAGDEESLRSAIELSTRPLLEGCLEPWVFPERENREQACLMALETLAGIAEQRGDTTGALALLRRAESLDNLRDSIQRQLMRVLAASGDTPAALLAYRDYRLRLHREMNVEPDADTVRLFQQIRARGREGGRGRRGEQEQERSEAGSSPHPLTPSPAPLPHPITALIGREEHVREVVARVAGSRLVTLAGAGGVGKTRLAIEAAREAADAFPAGAAFVALASLSDPALLPSFVATALGVREPGATGSESVLEALIVGLEAQPVLLVLDNCEHLIGAAAALCRTLLERCPRLHILTTSRQRLGLTGEVIQRVPSLACPDPEPLPPDGNSSTATVMQYPAVQLFVERAQMVKPGFRLTGRGDAAAVAQICQRLDGIPLAIELAAARAGVLSVPQIASRLGERFRLLTGGSRELLTRHQTLYALIDWSYELLTEPERALLRRLSVCVDGWTLEAAEAVVSGQWSVVLELLASLTDKSLVLAEEAPLSPQGRGAGEGLRYRMLETVREYAREKLHACGEEAMIRSAHAAYFLALAETAAAAIYGPEQLHWLNLLEAEHGNLRAALAGCLGTPGGEEVGRRLAAALAAFWELQGDLSEGREALSAALALPGAPADRTRARILVGAGRLGRLQGNWPAARAFWTEALGIWRQLGDRKGAAEMLEGLADLEKEEYHFASAVSLLEESLTHWRDLGDREGGARSLRLMAQIAEQQGLFPAARAGLEEALGLHREMGDRRAQAADLLALGKLLVDQGDCLTARTLLEECLAILREVADRWSAAEALFYLGRVGHALGDLGAARRHWEETLALDMEKMGRGGYVVLCLAQLTAAEGDATAARAQYEQFIRQELAAGTRSGAPSGLAALAELDWQEGDVARATTRFQESLALFEKVGDEDGILPGLYALWSAARHGGDDSSARAWRARLQATHQRISNRSRLVWSLNYLGIMARHDGDVRAAQALHTQSLTIGREIAYTKGVVAGIESVAGLAADQQQPDRAARLCGAAESLRTRVGHWRDLFDEANLQTAVAAARAALGPEPFAAAWAEGRAMSLDQAVEYASSDAARRAPTTRTHPASIHPVSPSHLPRPLTALIGREEEVEAVTALLDSARLVTLTGGGGVGKTRLALQVATRLEGRYPGRVLFVELAALADPPLLLASVAAALGLHQAGEAPALDLTQALAGWLSQEPTLLVLDNCEHLIEAAAALCQTLLQRCPRLHILATSRQRLGLTGEVVRRVPSLPAPDPEQLPPDAAGAVAHVLRFPAARLWIERAAAVRPGFELRDRDEALAVARLCQRLDGIPLALELAAARTTVLSAEQIAARLDDRFQLLTSGSRAALPRHQTLRALIDWSYDSLPAEEAALLRRLAVFAGGWTLEAAEAVCGGEGSGVWGAGRSVDAGPPFLHPAPPTLLPSPVLDLLDALEECSLVLAEAGAAGLRYRMLETVREYSLQKLQACGEEASVRAAHAAYFLALAETAAPAMHGPEQLPWLDLLEAEHDNLRAALEWCEKAVDNEKGLRLAAALWPFWEARGYLSEGRPYLRAALQPSGLPEAPARAQALLGAARLALHQGDLQEAEALAQEGQEWFRSQGDTRGRAMALLCRGEVAFARGQFGAAESLFTEGLEACRQSGWTQGSARALVKLGAVAMMLADTERARSPLEEGLALAKTLGDAPTLALALYERGCLAMREEEDARAGALLEQSVEIWRRLGHKQATAEALGALGRLAGRRKDRTRAASFLEQSAATYRELGARIDLAWTLQELGNVHYAGDAYVPARAAYEESLEIFRELIAPHGIACAANNLGMTCFHLGDPAGAEALHREALAIYVSEDHGEGMTWSLERLGLAAARRGDVLRAARVLAAAAAARERLALPKAEAEPAEWDQSITALRAGLPAGAFEAAWAEGQAMSLKEAIAYASTG